MGLERLARVLLGVDSVYETQAFRPLIRWLEQATGRPYESDRRSFRIIADHLRAATVIAADGVSAGNAHRGYVLRRLIRRAVRYGRSIGLSGPFCAEAAERVVELCGDVYPELGEQRQYVTGQLALEEERFGRTLNRGLRKLTSLLADRRELSGADAFSLHDTHGFPMELTIDLVRQSGGTLGPAFTEEFQARMAEQKARSRTAAVGTFKGGLGTARPRRSGSIRSPT
jgi:alanyl-tRNA synthetase